MVAGKRERRGNDLMNGRVSGVRVSARWHERLEFGVGICPSSGNALIRSTCEMEWNQMSRCAEMGRVE
jgi:hypothetical protein